MEGVFDAEIASGIRGIRVEHTSKVFRETSEGAGRGRLKPEMISIYTYYIYIQIHNPTSTIPCFVSSSCKVFLAGLIPLSLGLGSDWIQMAAQSCRRFLPDS